MSFNYRVKLPTPAEIKIDLPLSEAALVLFLLDAEKGRIVLDSGQR